MDDYILLNMLADQEALSSILVIVITADVLVETCAQTRGHSLQASTHLLAMIERYRSPHGA